ncbi:hypothetical protein CP985_10320 [Malaciobacter mytili LMG 24559]|uniref:Uncharacterized protein n=1 Tax=Malaciobacter mytili LMG 24559 TaxID=1032238 RepID=A0AAX2AG13_9BACT|nr:hypothetical protein [Malaciobacter mytili]AXH16430.1 hypothetical protein AMYT_a0132 [Malaciobacter mytili LMG 24559]RXK15090.1 hypothetical protein CP985_10320 [Malaciobacter mytili LMG 24559]
MAETKRNNRGKTLSKSNISDVILNKLKGQEKINFSIEELTLSSEVVNALKVIKNKEHLSFIIEEALKNIDIVSIADKYIKDNQHQAD